MSKSEKNIIGTGWAFPPAFDLHSKKAQMVTSLDDIVQSLNIIFGTRPGERILMPAFGCDIETSIFQNISLSEKTYLKKNISDAIIDFEPRIDLNKIDIDASQAIDGILHIQIDFTIRTTNTRHNMVYPFFIGEGTLIPKEIF